MEYMIAWAPGSVLPLPLSGRDRGDEGGVEAEDSAGKTLRWWFYVDPARPRRELRRGPRPWHNDQLIISKDM